MIYILRYSNILVIDKKEGKQKKQKLILLSCS